MHKRQAFHNEPKLLHRDLLQALSDVLSKSDNQNKIPTKSIFTRLSNHNNLLKIFPHSYQDLEDKEKRLVNTTIRILNLHDLEDIDALNICLDQVLQSIGPNQPSNF